MNIPVEKDLPPIETLQNFLRENNLNEFDLAFRLKLNISAAINILDGVKPIDEKLALRLQMFTGINCNFWLNKEIPA